MFGVVGVPNQKFFQRSIGDLFVSGIVIREKIAAWLGTLNLARVRGGMTQPVGMLRDCEQTGDLEHMWKPTLSAAKDLARKSLLMGALLAVLATWHPEPAQHVSHLAQSSDLPPFWSMQWYPT